MSSRTIFFFVIIAEIARHSRVAHCFKGFSFLEGYVSLPSRRWLARFRSFLTLPAQLFSVLGLLKTRKSRNREGPRTRRATLFVGLRRDREWSREENHLLVLPRDGPSSSRSSACYSSSLLFYGCTGVLNPFLLSAAVCNSCTPCRGFKTCVSKHDRAWVCNRCRSHNISRHWYRYLHR